MISPRLYLIVACIVPACNRDALPAIPVSTLVSQDGLDPEGRAQLAQNQELAFVPADIDLLAHVDLAGMVAKEPEAFRRLDFVLQAQQPAAWELLGAAGAGLGKEIESLYLVVRGEEALVGAVGALDEARLSAALAKETDRAATAVGNGSMFEWPRPAAGVLGGHDPGEEPFGEVAIGVEDGLLLIGAPALVKRALEVRAGRGRDVRRSPLAREIVSAPKTAMAWAALRADRDQSLSAFAPGLRSARLHANPPALEVRVEFGSADEAKAFEGRLAGLLAMGAKMARETPIGETLERLRGAKVTVTGPVLSLSATI